MPFHPRRLALCLVAAVACVPQPEPEAMPPGPAPASGGRPATGGAPTASTGGAPAPTGTGGAATPAGTGGAAAPPPPDAAPTETPPPDAPPAPSRDLPPCKRTVPVNDNAGLAAAITAAQPGDCIELADGEYKPPTPISPKGTAEAPIVIRGRSKLGARIIGPGRWQMDNLGGFELKNAAHVVLANLYFPGYSPVNIIDSNFCRITRCKFEEGAARADGNADGNRIDHNDFGPKVMPGHQAQAKHNATNTRIDHNFFSDVRPAGNGSDTVGLGCCGPEIDFFPTKSVLEHNLIVNCRGEAELISVKSSNNIIRYNTIRNSSGTVTLRAGRNNTIHGNFIFGGSGLRIYDSGHVIYNNYVEVGSALQANGSGGGHAEVRMATIVHNTFVGGVSMGGPGNVFANNLVTGGMNVGGAGGGGNLTGMAGLARRGDLLTVMSGGRGIDAAMGSFPFVVDDIDGQPRATPFDVGADEWSAEVGPRRPLTRADVGIDAP